MQDQILPLDAIRKGLKDKRLYAVSEATEISYPTLKKLADGVESNYTISTLRAVTRYINDSQLEAPLNFN
jgi:hypothetical protein